ncbi:2-C-methyl-D-erythritol 4-phosphate cytidylyltransferase [candidate division WOR-1 bacterium RIFOXYA12_FULL_52_29]|uniref:2-C-methyl-D-erythritol 4-phosphate cytidylyltransferase n=1 Tax=candidate division WOR-1 bacterium RIFOXYC12_FULL_54_18 TaxID=1802584 RepID=A0A1F4T598_UNCSA|nr:MAG: 2-C-methyl-D-erythritol 4-phosphate cytidylyltransferase [candidate division WOR-1 bacterium RIFOXYA2_FULL_51_19]OGC17300.1 MAG: 2-C-methyl-D-erythritol 4-phosphate cytidylyltransferase [candidate division WOR-1 bacterium RIFOXYA12_FULL_52_29]OGC26160.1 MAG: 2-C-methyl-D-erythritol 4-phosphate cytidylyltransferase [candidate division WOR-1 bacterium RIFOXYB2_FULL_45_9]OGC27717.1 MAG: 2-C-methyl-D-erythritol 4-phosphate cytidylyltransferase [candidate division WOR-1 bacterium RIFOXYC12_FU
MKTIAIIVAGGMGRRMGKDKQFLPIAGKPMVAWSLAAFERSKEVDGIILVVAKNNIAKAEKLKSKKLLAIALSGAERQDSVHNGLALLPRSAKIVLVHDGARPAIDIDTIAAAIRAAKQHGAAVVGVPVKDTVKRVTGDGKRIKETLDRSTLWLAQTPQAFKTSLLLKAYAKIKGSCTDDAMVMEAAGFPVVMVMGSYKNIKATTPEDLEYLERVLAKRS